MSTLLKAIERFIEIPINNGILLSHKKEQNNAICSNKWSKWSKSERERQIPCGITYIWNLIYCINEPFHRKETHGLGEQTCGCQGEEGGSEMDWEFGVNRCKQLHLAWLSNEILYRELYLVTCYGTWWRMMWEKEYIYVCVCVYKTGSLCHTAESNRTL